VYCNSIYGIDEFAVHFFVGNITKKTYPNLCKITKKKIFKKTLEKNQLIIYNKYVSLCGVGELYPKVRVSVHHRLKTFYYTAF